MMNNFKKMIKNHKKIKALKMKFYSITAKNLKIKNKKKNYLLIKYFKQQIKDIMMMKKINLIIIILIIN